MDAKSTIAKLCEQAQLLRGKRWTWWTSNSYRRLTFDGLRDGGALHAFKNPADGWPDISMSDGVQEFIELASPANVLAIADHIADLIADRDSWRDQASQRVKDWDDMRQERDKALARVAELEADAARYRWLRNSDWYIGPAPQGDLIGVSWDDNNDAEGSLDQAIDRAAAAQGGGE
jgi:hypothetical protein